MYNVYQINIEYIFVILVVWAITSIKYNIVIIIRYNWRQL